MTWLTRLLRLDRKANGHQIHDQECLTRRAQEELEETASRISQRLMHEAMPVSKLLMETLERTARK